MKHTANLCLAIAFTVASVAMADTPDLTASLEPFGEVREATADGVLDFAVETEDEPSSFFKIEVVR